MSIRYDIPRGDRASLADQPEGVITQDVIANDEHGRRRYEPGETKKAPKTNPVASAVF